MIWEDLSVLVLLLVASFLAAFVVLAIIGLLFRRRDRPRGALDPHAPEPAVFLFDNGFLVDATERAHQLLERQSGDTAWSKVLDCVAGAVPGGDARIEALPMGQDLDLPSDPVASGLVRITAEWRNGLLRLTMFEPEAKEHALTAAAARRRGMERSAELLRAIEAQSPGPIWTTSAEGQEVLWANEAYMDLVRDVKGRETPGSPQSAVFEDDRTEDRRVSVLRASTGQAAWYDLHHSRFGSETIHFATPVDAAVAAQSALRDVVQTLAKTFAHLPIGLAIFDRDRRLVLFNPALTDLSGLPVGFLGERPTLAGFLDELRNRRFLAEPKDYKAWRQMLTQLEAEASRGTYSETWSLPDGRTFRVSGRPHAEGAIAFLFEDITDEVALTRRFRKDVALGQAILDGLPDALAVFSREGVLTLANAAYARLWAMDPGSTIGDVSVTDAARRWLEMSRPSPVWGDLREFVTAISNRTSWWAEVDLLDDRRFDLHCTPLSGGDTLVVFRARRGGASEASGGSALQEPIRSI